MRQRGAAPSIRVPSRVQSHVRHNHLCLASRCLAAGSTFLIYRYAGKLVVIAGWKTWCNCLLDFQATGIDQQDAAETSTGSLFYNSAQGFENGFQRTAPGSHFQDEILSGEQTFRALSVFDIGVRSKPFDNSAVTIERRSRTEKKPTIHAIKTAQARFHFTWLARIQNGSPVIHESVHVVRVKGNRPSPITRLFGCETGILEPALVEEISGTVRTSGPRECRDCVNHKANVLCLPSQIGGIRCGWHRVIRCPRVTRGIRSVRAN